MNTINKITVAQNLELESNIHILYSKKETRLSMYDLIHFSNLLSRYRVQFNCNMSTATATTTNKEGILYLSPQHFLLAAILGLSMS